MEEVNQAPKFKPIIDELKFNKLVRSRLDAIRSKLDKAESSDDILSMLTDGNVSGEMAYKNSIGFLIATIASVFLGLALYSMYVNSVLSNNMNKVFLFAGLAMVAVYFVYTWKERARKKLIEKIFSRYEETRYAFTYQGNQSKIEFDQNIKLFDRAFDRGNYSNRIEKFASGGLEFNGKHIEYTLMHYKFMHRYVEAIKRGRRKETYTTDHIYNVHGVLISDVVFPAFSISTAKDDKYYDVPWTTSNGDFNDRFCVSAKSEIEVARLFQPRNVLWFEKVFDNMPYESQKRLRSGNDKHRKIEYTCLNHTEIITSDDYPSLFWSFNINVFDRSWDGKKKFKTTSQLAKSLKTVELKGFEKFRGNINLLLERAV